MEHPYRVHSSIGFGFLQLLFISSFAYPGPTPQFYNNIAIIRLMATVYFTIFQDRPLYLKLECFTILLEIISDTLYIRYIIKDYTYIFSVIDIISNSLFFVFVALSLKNTNDAISETKEITEKIDEIRKTCVSCCFGCKYPTEKPQQLPTHEQPLRSREKMTQENTMNSNLYKSVPNDDNMRYKHGYNNDDTAPIYTFGSRQAFKPSFYSSSWGREYINTKVNQEFEKIEKRDTELGDIGIVSSPDGTTQYIQFDEQNYGLPSGSTGISHYANIFVSPYFTKDGTQITSFTGCTNIDKIGVCLFIYNIFQFIYQLMIYSSIVISCRDDIMIMNIANTTTFNIERWLC